MTVRAMILERRVNRIHSCRCYDQHTLDVPAHGEPHVKCTQDTGKQSQNSYPCSLFEILPEALEEQLDHAALTVSDVSRVRSDCDQTSLPLLR